MRARQVRRLLLTGMVLAIASSLTVPAAAHNKRFKTRVTIEEVKPNQKYEGQVNSGSRACERRRVLRFWYDDPGGKDIAIGKPFRANNAGHWEFEVLVGTDYYVTAKKVVKTPGDHRHICKADRSPTV